MYLPTGIALWLVAVHTTIFPLSAVLGSSRKEFFVVPVLRRRRSVDPPVSGASSCLLQNHKILSEIDVQTPVTKLTVFCS